jgi:flagellar motor switch protein FliN/FliY
MSEILSQDQIDSLLGKAAPGGAPIPGDEDAGGTQAAVRDYTALAKAFELFNEQASTVISTVLNKDISFTIQQCQKADKSVVFKAPANEMLVITASFKTGVPGVLYCIVGKKTVAMLSDLMMMGDGSAEFSEDHKDAIAELFSQVMGAYTSALSDKIGEQVSQGSVSAAECDYANLPFNIDASDMAVLSLSIGGTGTTEFIMVVPEEPAAHLASKMKAAQQGPSGGESRVGLNSAELEDLSQVTAPSGAGDSSFTEAPISGDTMRTSAPRENVDMLLDIELDVTIELGRTNLSIKRILEMGPGSIVELERMAGEPVDLLVNNKVVAKGEVVVVDENFGIRIVSLVSPEERIRSLR